MATNKIDKVAKPAVTPQKSKKSAKKCSNKRKTAARSISNPSRVVVTSSSRAHVTHVPTSFVAYDHWPILSGRNGHVPVHQRGLAVQHDLFHLSTVGDKPGVIRNMAYMIPYASQNEHGRFLKSLDLTGFDTFEYQFKHGEKTYIVSWDYNNGYTRTTPFFKALMHAKAFEDLKKGSAYKDMAVHLNGGKSENQGFWLPHAVARALAITFCYDIRYALTPIFGPTFPDECLKHDHPQYQKFKIDPRVIADAQREITDWKARVAASRASTAAATGDSTSNSTTTQGGGSSTRSDAATTPAIHGQTIPQHQPQPAGIVRSGPSALNQVNGRALPSWRSLDPFDHMPYAMIGDGIGMVDHVPRQEEQEEEDDDDDSDTPSPPRRWVPKRYPAVSQPKRSIEDTNGLIVTSPPRPAKKQKVTIVRFPKLPTRSMDGPIVPFPRGKADVPSFDIEEQKSKLESFIDGEGQRWYGPRIRGRTNSEIDRTDPEQLKEYRFSDKEVARALMIIKAEDSEKAKTQAE